nr:hypothetical protein Iba_chr04dCG14720 [Ipomoea batatas]
MEKLIGGKMTRLIDFVLENIRLSLALVTAPQALVGVGGPGVATRISRRRRAGFAGDVAASPPLQATVIASSSMETSVAIWHGLNVVGSGRREEARHLDTSSVFGALCIVSEDDVLSLASRQRSASAVFLVEVCCSCSALCFVFAFRWFSGGLRKMVGGING